ncbi:MAG: hypothetical protein JNG90_03600 [Planctomycetaceae bacterium]|nr:hypothetical protein [Planctomycetaceae bacterium]
MKTGSESATTHPRATGPHFPLAHRPAEAAEPSLAPSAAPHLWFERAALVKAVAAGIVAWIVLELLFLAFVHRDLEGDAHRAFLPGDALGVGLREAAAGYRPVSQIGYDGQLYYTISNDLLGWYDAAAHLDNVVYRYQRIGIPALAGGLATLLGYDLTPPMLFHTLNLGLTAAGFGGLVYWLLIHQLRTALALGWLLSIGTLQSLCRGLLDAPADALFVLMMLALLARRLWVYLPLAVLLLLTREMYALVAAGVFVVTACQRFPWRDVSGYWQRVALTAAPGAVMLGWMLYLSLHFDQSPFASREAPGFTSYPFYAMYKAVAGFVATGNWTQAWPAVATAAMLLVAIVGLAANVRRLPWALVCAIPYVLMCASLGPAQWLEYQGSTRIMNVSIVLGLLLMPFDKSIFLPAVVALQALLGVTLTAETRLASSVIVARELVHEREGIPLLPPEAPTNSLLNEPRCRIAWIDAAPVCRRRYDGIWNAVHRELRPVAVAVTNLTDVTWHPGHAPREIWLQYRLYDASYQSPRFLARHAVLLDQEIPPGETRTITTYLELRRPGRKYAVEFTLWQEGPGAFDEHDPQNGGRYEFRVE